MNSKPNRDTRFRRRERLRHARDFQRVYNKRHSAADSALVVYMAPNDLEWSRLGISVSRRIGNAVVRVRSRRKIREAFRRCKSDLPRGMDIICVVRKRATDRDHDLQTSLLALISILIRSR